MSNDESGLYNKGKIPKTANGPKKYHSSKIKHNFVKTYPSKKVPNQLLKIT